MEFSWQENWSGLPFPSPGDLPNPGMEPVFPALQADILPSEPPGKFLRHQGMRGCNCAQVSRPPPPPPAPHPQLPSQHSASAIPATGMGLLPASPLCPPIPLRTKVRLSGGLSDKTGEGGGGEKASRVSQGACPLAPPPLPSPCNFLSLRWREGNVKDDGLKGGSWGQKRRDHRVEGKGNTQEAGGRVQGREGAQNKTSSGVGRATERVRGREGE